MAVVKSLNSDKSISESFQEVLDEGYDIPTKIFEEFSEKNALLQSRFYDEDGKPPANLFVKAVIPEW